MRLRRPTALLTVCTWLCLLAVTALLAEPSARSQTPGSQGVARPGSERGATLAAERGAASRAMPASMRTSSRSSLSGRLDPADWSSRRLAAQLTFACVDAAHVGAARRYAAAGIGGVTLLGSHAPRDLRRRLGAVKAAAPFGIRPFIASDEEGGRVQRLAHLIYPLPSARAMGRWGDRRVEQTARRYGARMTGLGVRMALAPVADLAVPGYYISSMKRAFARDPSKVARKVVAWQDGMSRAGVVTVVKHWPGHGQAANTHNRPARVPGVRALQRRDMVPFERAVASGASVVMVGHLTSRGLTQRGVPASMSATALAYLRDRIGGRAVLMTDSLSMAAASSALGISPARAAVRAVRAGADWALVCNANPRTAVEAIRAAIRSGAIPRAQAVASVDRILRLKARSGLVSR